MENREDWLHYIHAWDEPGIENYEMSASVGDIEEILANELVRKFEGYKLEKDPHKSIFYHDPLNAGALVCVDEDFYIHPSRYGLLRVIGCGHFLLSIYRRAIDDVIANYAGNENVDEILSYLRAVRSDWEQGPLDMTAPCDVTIGTGNYLNDFADNWLLLNASTSARHSPEQVEDLLSVIGVQFMCRTMCFSDFQLDTPNSERNAYKEFLFLHMCCAIKQNSRRPNDPRLLMQCRLMNRRFQMPLLSDQQTSLPVLVLPPEIETAVRNWAKRARRAVADKAAISAASKAANHDSSDKQQSAISSTYYRRSASSVMSSSYSTAVTSGAGQTRTARSSTGAVNSTTMDHRSKNTAMEEAISMFDTSLKGKPARQFDQSKMVGVAGRDWTSKAGGVTGLKELAASVGIDTKFQYNAWHPIENFTPSDWFQGTDGRMVKAVDKRWMVGCMGSGCPTDFRSQVQKKVIKDDKCKGYCKQWLVVKETRLVKRPSGK